MKALGGLLDRFKTLEAPERVVRSAVVEAVKGVVGVSIKSHDIKIDNKNVIHLGVPSTVRAAIFESKDNIISRVNNLLKKSQVKDIK